MSDRRAWLCPQCAQFSTRPDDVDAPSHPCAVAGVDVALVEYVDSTQAEQLRCRINARR